MTLIHHVSEDELIDREEDEEEEKIQDHQEACNDYEASNDRPLDIESLQENTPDGKVQEQNKIQNEVAQVHIIYY